MARFNGSNDLGTIDVAVERSNYKYTAFPEGNGMGPPGIRDYNQWELTKFGRIDFGGNAIIPNVDHLIQITNYQENDSTIVGHRFAVLALNDMRRHMARAYQTGILPVDHPYFHPFAIYRGYESPINGYQRYVDGVLSNYELDFLSEPYYNERVRNFGDYMNFLPHYIEQFGERLPITFTAWHRSKFSSMFTSGFVFDIAGQPLSEDDFKDDLFLSTKQFSYYFKLAKYYGFNIHKNAPFVLVANISSPAMQKYITEAGFDSAENIINTGFQKVYRYDIESLKNRAFESYNLYATTSPYIKKVNFCPEGNVKYSIKRRFQINQPQLQSKYPAAFYLNNYINIRNIEENSPLKEADLRRAKQRASYFLRTLGPNSALEYANEQFRSLYSSKPGTFHHWKTTQNII